MLFGIIKTTSYMERNILRIDFDEGWYLWAIGDYEKIIL